MSSMVVEKNVCVNATASDCIEAFRETISQLDGYSIRAEMPATGQIEVDKKAEFIKGGYGENITFTVVNRETGCNVSIVVSPKGLPYLLWRTNCEKVAQQVLSTFSTCVEKYTQPNQNCNVVSVADEIKKYKELLDLGAITQEEYDSKKAQLLNQ